LFKVAEICGFTNISSTYELIPFEASISGLEAHELITKTGYDDGAVLKCVQLRELMNVRDGKEVGVFTDWRGLSQCTSHFNVGG
jgi:hypothetical protein